MIGLQGQGLIKALQGLLRLLQGQMGYTQIVVGCCTVRRNLDRGADQLDRARRLAALLRDHAQQVAGIKVVGLTLQHSMVLRPGLFETAGAMLA